MILSTFEETVNRWGQQRVPFLFIVDFEMEMPIAIRLDEVQSRAILFSINGVSNATVHTGPLPALHLVPTPLAFSAYRRKFQDVYHHLERGDSYLTNLTIRSGIDVSVSLEQLYFISHARYKLLVKDRFLVFSPEIFVQIRNNEIYSYPMKGTINASIPNAAEIILKDKKELAEHVTIVDLIRNDLSQVSKNVHVSRFRYVEEIRTHNNHLFQVSSQISGTLENAWNDRIGTLLLRLLPAGSVSGAPKSRTVEIIREAEGEKRGYYTGVFGIFNGQDVDSGVMIRFVEENNGKLFYRSGGGITTQSVCEAEYQEAIDKIYVPIN
jgi:para-aminobenzoate synthetase component I